MNPLLISAAESVLLIVDVQSKLLDVIPDHQLVLWNLQRLMQGAVVLDVPRLATEQYPEKLGPTHALLRELFSHTQLPGKLSFSCAGCAPLVDQLKTTQCRQVVIAGIESHVCVLQTALDLLSDGFDVFVVADAIAARRKIDTEIALRRMETAGVTLVTAEAVLFEWCRRAGTAEFKQISQIVRTEP